MGKREADQAGLLLGQVLAAWPRQETRRPRLAPQGRSEQAFHKRGRETSVNDEIYDNAGWKGPIDEP